MIARYDGECEVCDGLIRAGRDEIVRDADGAWVHARIEDCDAELVAQANGTSEPKVCTMCRCVMPCWCDDGGHPEDAPAQALRRYTEAAGRDPFDGFLS